MIRQLSSVTDYQSLIAHAVEGVASDRGAKRRALYERARTALVTQLRAVDPPLPESVIAKERFALESAIRKVEADAARKVPLGREPHSAATRPQSIASASRSVTTGLGPSKQEADQSGDRIAPRATTETAGKRPPENRSQRLSTLLSREAVRSSRNIMRGADDFGGATVQPAQSPNNESSGSTEHYSAKSDSESDADDVNAKHQDSQQAGRYGEAPYDGEEGDKCCKLK